MNRKLLLLIALLCLVCGRVNAAYWVRVYFKANIPNVTLGYSGQNSGHDHSSDNIPSICNYKSFTWDKMTFTFTAPTVTGYTFKGWKQCENDKFEYSDNGVYDATTSQYSFDVNAGAFALSERAATKKYVIAIYEPNTYTIQFNSNGGEGTTASVNATYDQDATLTTSGFSKAGYTFTGWNTQADGNGTPYENNATVKNLTAENNGTVTLYAIYTPKNYELTIKNGFGTFGNNDFDIDLSNDNFTAYRAGEVSDTSLKFYPITYLPNGQGAFLMGADGTYEVSVAASAGETKKNYMKAGKGEIPSNGYVLASNESAGYPLGFYKSSVAVPEGKAYLEYAGTTQVKGFAVMASEFGEDEVTAISIVNAESEEDDAYSVTGVKVGGNYRGIVIKNGKKLLQK